jgi:stress response protein YsnF
LNSGNSWLDLTLNFQRELQMAAFQSFSSYSPAADTRISGRVPQAGTTGVQVVPVGEERLNVAVHTVQGETTRVRRRVVAQPVEQQVTLRDEKVVVERRRPATPEARGDVLSETVVEMSDSHQVPTVWKSQHVAEEVVLRMQVTERTETVRDTVRRDVVDVEHDRAAIAPRTGNVPANPLPASLTSVEETPRVIGQAARAAEAAEKKPAASLPAGTRA